MTTDKHTNADVHTRKRLRDALVRHIATSHRACELMEQTTVRSVPDDDVRWIDRRMYAVAAHDNGKSAADFLDALGGLGAAW